MVSSDLLSKIKALTFSDTVFFPPTIYISSKELLPIYDFTSLVMDDFETNSIGAFSFCESGAATNASTKTSPLANIALVGAVKLAFATLTDVIYLFEPKILCGLTLVIALIS